MTDLILSVRNLCRRTWSRACISQVLRRFTPCAISAHARDHVWKPITTLKLSGLLRIGIGWLQVLDERDFPYSDLKLLASARSAGKTYDFQGTTYTCGSYLVSTVAALHRGVRRALP